MRKPGLVVKSNQLIEASYRLTLVEQRIILAAIVEARESQQGLGEGLLSLNVSRFVEMFGMDEGSAYAQIKDAIAKLFTRLIIVRDTHPETGLPRVSKVRWISTASYIDGAAVIQLRFAADMVPYITRLEKEFTAYRIEKIGRMTSVHAVRLYELLVQYLRAGSREVAIAWLKDALQIADEYRRIDHFKRDVLDVAEGQINEHSDIRVSHTQRKTGRAVTHLNFTIRPEKIEPPAPRKPAITRAYVERNAHPGESYEDAERRLRAKTTTQKGKA